MNEVTSCQGCGAALPHAEAVCSRCDAEPPVPTRSASAGPHACPQCHQRFAEPVPVLWPPRVPWWRPTTFRLQCPHCETPLRDRYVAVNALFFLGLAVAYAVLSETAWQHRRLWAGPIIVSATLWLFLRHRRAGRDPGRYVAGAYPQWLRDIRGLWRNTKR